MDGIRVVRRYRDGQKRLFTHQVGLAGEHLFNKFDLDWKVDYVRTESHTTRHRTAWENRIGKDGVADYIYDRSDYNFPVWDAESTAEGIGHIYDYANTTFADMLQQSPKNTNEALELKFNVKIPVKFGENPGAIKFGAKIRNEQKDVKRNIRDYRWQGADKLRMSDFLNTNNRYFTQSSSNTPFYDLGFFNDKNKILDFWKANVSPDNDDSFNGGETFTFSQSRYVRTSVLNSYTTDEDVYALYLMGEVDIGKLHLIAGVRWESTDLTFNPNRLIDQDGDATLSNVEKFTGSRKYDQLFPSIVARYNFTDNLILRAAYTTGIARPGIGNYTGTITISSTDNEVTAGNPNLLPALADNFDLSLEYYSKSIGVLSVGIFHKSIDNFIFGSRRIIPGSSVIGGILLDPIDPDSQWSFDSTFNAGTAKLTGVEFAFSQQFSFLPSPWDGIGISANATFIDGEVTGIPDFVSDRSSLTFVPGQSEGQGQVGQVLDLQVYYEKYGWTLRLALHSNGSAVNNVGGDAFSDEFIEDDFNVSMSVSHQITERFRWFVNFVNIADTPKVFFAGNRTLPIELEFSGWSVMGGVKFNL